MAKTKHLVCPECGKELKNARSVAGHMWFAHGKRVGEKQGLHDKIDKLKQQPKITDDIAEKIEGIYAFLHNVEDDVLKALQRITEATKSLAVRLDKLETANPGNPGGPEDPNPEEVKPDGKEVKSDDEEDDGLPNFFGKKKKSDDEKESEKVADEKSWLL